MARLPVIAALKKTPRITTQTRIRAVSSNPLETREKTMTPIDNIMTYLIIVSSQ